MKKVEKDVVSEEVKLELIFIKENEYQKVKQQLNKIDDYYSIDELGSLMNYAKITPNNKNKGYAKIV